MPTYEYKCHNCDFDFEIFHAMSQEVTICPRCKEKSLNKLIGTGSAVIIRGTETPTHHRHAEQLEKFQEQKRLKREKMKENAPWWRSNNSGKIRTDILKNPKKYIEEGKIS